MPVWLLPLIFQLLSAIPGLIQVVEVAFSGAKGKSGIAKKQLVMDSVAAGIAISGTLNGTPVPVTQKDAIMGTVGALVDTTVAVLKTVDALKNPVADAGGPNEV